MKQCIVPRETIDMATTKTPRIKDAKTGQFQLKITAEQLKVAADAYLLKCEKTGIVPFLSEFTLELGIADETLRRYKRKKAYQSTIIRLEKHEENGLKRTVAQGSKPIGSMFLLKAKHGYIEANKLDVTTNGHDLGVVLLPGLKASK